MAYNPASPQFQQALANNPDFIAGIGPAIEAQKQLQQPTQNQPMASAYNLPPTGLIGSEQAIRQGLTGQLGSIAQGVGSAQGEIDLATAIARGDINQGYGQAQQALSPYGAGGAGATNIQAALSGSLGPQAQAEAFKNYQQSPGQAYALEQGRRNLLAGASATGGLGGGNVQRELMRQGIGMAQQNFQQDFNNLGTIANRGMATAGQQAGLNVGQGQNLANITTGAGQNLANLALQGGVLPAQAIGSAAGQLAQGRFGTGQQIAQAAGTTSANLANLQNQLGQGMANQYGQGSTNLANIVSGAGQGSSQLQQQLSTILANIGTGAGSQQAGYANTAAQYDAAGILGQNQAVQNTLGQLLQLIPQGGGVQQPQWADLNSGYGYGTNPYQSGTQISGSYGQQVG